MKNLKKNWRKRIIRTGLKKISDNRGFSLVEVLIAVTIFAVFASAFISSQTSNVTDSTQLSEELIIHRICENKINEIILNPPQLQESLTLSKETKNFEEDDFKDYEYIVEWRRLKLPNFAQLMNKSSDEDSNKGSTSMQIQVFDKLKKNIEEMIWQVSVTVRNKNTNYQFILTSWIDNPDAKVSVQ